LPNIKTARRNTVNLRRYPNTGVKFRLQILGDSKNISKSHKGVAFCTSFCKN